MLLKRIQKLGLLGEVREWKNRLEDEEEMRRMFERCGGNRRMQYHGNGKDDAP